jgi:hypothetical protein
MTESFMAETSGCAAYRREDVIHIFMFAMELHHRVRRSRMPSRPVAKTSDGALLPTATWLS